VRPEDAVEFAEALARIAASGGGAKALATHLAQTCGGGVLLEDANWRHVAAAGSGTFPATARNVVEAGAPGRAVRVSAGNHHIGWLSLFGTDSDPDAELMLRLAAAVLGSEMGRDDWSRGRKTGFWESAIGGAFHDSATAREEATLHGVAVAPNYITVALEAEAETGAERPDVNALRALATDCFRCAQAEVGFVERGATLFVLVPAMRAVDASNAKTAATLLPRNAARRKPPLRVSGGASGIETLSALAHGAGAAETALAIGRRLFGAGHVALYDELGAYRFLYEGAGVERLRAFASAALAPLRAYDEKHQTELERTLKLYFEVGQNVKTAAAQLNVHRHTVFYRLRQIAEITGRSLESPHDQLTLRLAVAIDELHDST
jgi:PucR C-terminal helix-turn-helix domain